MKEIPNHTSTFLKLAKSLTKLEYSLPVDLRGGERKKRGRKKTGQTISLVSSVITSI